MWFSICTICAKHIYILIFKNIIYIKYNSNEISRVPMRSCLQRLDENPWMFDSVIWRSHWECAARPSKKLRIAIWLRVVIAIPSAVHKTSHYFAHSVGNYVTRRPYGWLGSRKTTRVGNCLGECYSWWKNSPENHRYSIEGTDHNQYPWIPRWFCLQHQFESDCVHSDWLTHSLTHLHGSGKTRVCRGKQFWQGWCSNFD